MMPDPTSLPVTSSPMTPPSATPFTPPASNSAALFSDPSRPRSGPPSDYAAYDRAPRALRAAPLAKALGWFSIGLGLAQLLAPRVLSRAAGLPDQPALLRTLGARELVSGVGILRQRPPTAWIWTRVAGDAIDLALLGLAAHSRTSRRDRLALTAAAVAGATALDVFAGMRSARTAGMQAGMSGSIDVETAVTINRSPDECYQFWRNVDNFPRFMQHLESVRDSGADRWHWVAKAPTGARVEWDAELTADVPGQLLAWRAVASAQVANAGTIRFEPAPGGRGTVVRVQLQYSPPGGKAGARMAHWFGAAPEQQITEEVRRFKQLIETGEIPTTIGQPSGPRDLITRLFFKKGAPG